MASDSKNQVKNVRQRRYLNKDFDSLRSDLLLYARTFFSDRIRDFSEASLGGLLLDLAAYVGDVQSYYLDHQFGELDPETAVENRNIERHIRNAGVEITGAAPAVVDVTFFIEVPAVQQGSVYVPDQSALPIILQGSILTSNSGIDFELTEDVDFSDTNRDGTLKADLTIGSATTDGIPVTYIMSLKEACISGFRTSESFSIPNTFVQFRTIELSNANVTEVTSVKDSDGNTYYEVDSLTQDTVFRGIVNKNDDNDLVTENVEILPAPYRFIKKTALDTRVTTIQFGGGRGDTLDNDIIPDPSEFAVPLYGKRTFSRFTIDPKNLLQTRTLGVAPQNTTVTVDYRYGGGLSHNVAAESIRTVTSLVMKFPLTVSPSLAAQVRASVDVLNVDPASGGEDPLSSAELRSRVPAARNAQSRIVSKEDLITRVYTMPSNFGRVFRAGVRSNPNNPLATQLFIVSRNADGQLVPSPDSLKLNLSTYLNEFRMISDAIDILDANIFNFKIRFQVATEPAVNKNVTVQGVIEQLKNFFDIKNFEIDQPIIIDDITNIIFNSPGVLSVINLEITNIAGTVGDREYSSSRFDVTSNTFKGMIIPPPGSMFELKYPNVDIIGSAS